MKNLVEMQLLNILSDKKLKELKEIKDNNKKILEVK